MNNVYKIGFQAGYRDAELISNSANTDSHTFEQYLSIKNLYEEAICSVDNWSKGYADGFDRSLTRRKLPGFSPSKKVGF